MYMMLKWRYMEIYKQSFSFCGDLSWNALQYIFKSELNFSGFNERLNNLFYLRLKVTFIKSYLNMY